MGRNFWMRWKKPSKLAPSMTMLGGLWKIIAGHTVVSGFGPYVSSRREDLGWDFKWCGALREIG